MNVGIIDYGSGNIGSIKKLLNKFKVDFKIIKQSDDFEEIDKLIMPGQGAFENAMESLKRTKLDLKIFEFHKQKKPILAICLGMQLLFDKSFEFNECEGLKIFEGYVKKINIDNIKIPVIGWYKLSKIESNINQSIFNCLSSNSSLYFAHSMYCSYKGNGICSYVKYNNEFILASVEYENIFATQFHPELSDNLGCKIIENFLDLPY